MKKTTTLIFATLLSVVGFTQDIATARAQGIGATVTITGVDDLPHADNKSVFTPENTALDILLSSTDPDGGDNSNIQYEITSSSSNGSTSLNGTTVTYTPNTDFHGSDSFQNKVSGDNTIATVSIDVNEVVGISKIFPDLVSSGYNEWFNDIVYDESTGGYLVGDIREILRDTLLDLHAKLMLSLNLDIHILLIIFFTWIEIKNKVKAC